MTYTARYSKNSLKIRGSPRKHVKGAAASRKAEGAFKGLKGARFTEILH